MFLSKNIISFSILFLFLFPIDGFSQAHNQFNDKGKRTGVWRKYYTNKRIRYIGTFKDGKEVGTFKFYDITSSEHPVVIKVFDDKSDEAFVKFYTTKGVLKSQGKMRGRDRIGKWLYYFPSGKTMIEEVYVNGKIEGKVTQYYKDGSLFETAYYKNGLKDGPLKRYSDNEVLIEDVLYKKGKLNGEAKYYDLKGNLKEKGIYKDNKRFGKWEFYLEGELVNEKEKKKQGRYKRSELKKNDTISKN